MSQKLTRFEKISIANIFITLLISFITLFLSYNSYKISINTYNNSESINRINDRQSEYELKNSILSMVTISSMLKQTEAPTPDLNKCIKSFNEIKNILESQIKNNNLIEKPKLSDMWLTLIGDVDFQIKFFEEGLKPNSIIDGASQKISDIDKATNDLFDEFNKEQKAP